jgi:hypothetical protein
MTMVRVDELADELGFSADELVDACAELGFVCAANSEVDVTAIKAALAGHAVRVAPEASASVLQTTKPCPYCGERIFDVAVKCKHCGEFLAGESTAVAVRTDPRVPTAAIGATIAAGAALVVASFLPWATIRAPFVGQLTKSGMEGGDGIISLALGVLAAALGFARLAGRRHRALFVGLVGVAALALAVFEIADVQSHFADIHASADGDLVITSVGAGLWVMGLAGCWLVGLAVRISGTDRSQASVGIGPR